MRIYKEQESNLILPEHDDDDDDDDDEKICITYMVRTQLLVFERKILRRIFGPTKENQIWRVKPNEELDKLIKHKNIINYELKD